MDTEVIDEDTDGAIQSIHVRNFFCHDNLEINLNRNVNFIVGRNGSGKSAILTALVVGLGGRASATNRGNNLSSFVKKGANSATIEIKIKNSSPKAYKHDIYGDSITIVRHITSSGVSSYKVKSATGEVKSTKFEEVNAITLAHDIQVDNPISVLNQDDARSFHASDAKKKYSLFRKATNLDQTEANYNRALENCRKAEDTWKRKSAACVELEKDYKKWKTTLEHLQSHEEMEEKKKALQNEYYWSEVAELDREVTIVQAQYDKQNAKIEKMVDKLKEMTESDGNSEQTIKSLEAEMEKKSGERSFLERQVSEVEGKLREMRASARAAQAELAKCSERLGREKRKVVDLEAEIDNIESGSASSRRGELERAARSAREAAESARARYDTAQHDAAQKRAAAAHAQAQADRASASLQAHNEKIKQLRQQVRELESRGDDSLAVYGDKMVVLCQKVREAERRGEFSAPPRGPVGAHIKVKEKRWGGAVEHILGGSVHAFCVNSPEDSRKLFALMGQVYGGSPKPSVTCSKFLERQHDVRRNAVRARTHRSALDALHVVDPVVANYLIDNLSLETVLLVPDHDEAIRLSDTVENVPENCSKIVTLDCTEYHPAPNYRCYGGSARPARFLHLSTAERKKQVLGELSAEEQSRRAIEAASGEAASAASEAREAERVAARTLHALLAEVHTRDEATRRAEAALQELHAPHHAVLADELNLSKEKVRTLSEQAACHAAKVDEWKQKSDECEASLAKLQNKLAEASSACRSLTEEIGLERLKSEQWSTERHSQQQRLREARLQIDKVRGVLAERRRLADEKREAALALCPPLNNPRDTAVVLAELQRTQLKLSSLRGEGVTRAEAGERLLRAERRYRRTKAALESLRALIAEVRRTADDHLRFCRTVQDYIARRVQYCFSAVLAVRGYSGHMDIDNARATLEVACAGRDAGVRRAASTSSLSGGERSYSTVAFIMALWDCVELPFYLMDEFDVFMDNVNRKIVMELLVDHALNNTARQFVFLTPQDTSAVSASDRIKIHVMADPRP